MYEVDPSPEIVDAAVSCRRRLRRAGPRAGRGAPRPARRTTCSATWSTTELSEDEMVAVGGAAAQRRPRGVGQRVRQRAGRDAAARAAPGRRRGGDASRRCCASTPRSSCSSAPRPRTCEVGDVVVEAGQKIAVLLGAANRDPAVFDEPDEFRVDRDPNNHVAFGVGVHFCLGRAAGPDGAGRVAGARCGRRTPTWRWRASRRAGGRSCCGASVAFPWEETDV